MAFKKRFFNKKQRENTDPTGSQEKGIKGIYEAIFRRFKTLTHLLTIFPMYLLASLVLAAAFTPASLLFLAIYDAVQFSSPIVKAISYSFGLGAGFYLFGVTLLLVVPWLNYALCSRLEPARGPYYSVKFLPWYIHNGLTYLVRYTVLEFFTPTPINHWFYRRMGMKIGKGAQINSTQISDPMFIQIDEKVTIGGSVTLAAHYGMAGYLILAPIRIREGATLGLRAIVMGGADIGKNAKVLGNSLVLPKTVIPDGEIWGGVPAKKLSIESIHRVHESRRKRAA